MQEGRFSTIRFNEWICVTAQYEKAVARLGRQVYQGYSRGLLVDFTSLEICKQISDTFAEAREMREELEEELERDALDGLNLEETKVADEHRSLTQAQKTKRTIKLKLTKFLGRAAINRKLAAHRNQVRDLSRDLGLRALACYKDNALLKVKGHKSLCRLAEQLSDDADTKWQEIVKINKEQGGGLSFHTILINFIGSFANFGKNTPFGRAVLKYFKYDEAAENKKLKDAYQGSATAETLKAQLEEIEEPHLDVGREMDNMQQEYEETPVEWNLPSIDKPQDPISPTSYEAYNPPAPEPTLEKWEPEADTWDPGTSSDDDFLDAFAEAPALEPADEPPPPSSTSGPTLLRRRPEPEAEPWAEPTNLPSISKETTSAPAAQSSQEAASDDWDWSNSESADNWDSPAPQNAALQNATPTAVEPDPFLDDSAGDPFGFENTAADPFLTPQPPSPAQVPQVSAPIEKAPAAQVNDDWFLPDTTPAVEKNPASPAEGWSRKPAASAGSAWAQEPAGATRPPFVKSQPKDQPLGDWSSEPAPPKSTSSWGSDSIDEDYGWSVPKANSPAASAEQPFGATTSNPETPPAAPVPPNSPPFAQPKSETTAFIPPMPPLPSEEPDADLDPLLRLLRADGATPSLPTSQSSEESFDDDLLPDFLKNRDDDESSADDAFIPELPSFLAKEDGPQLEIVPFGSKEDFPAVKLDGDSDEEPFIPQMPDL